jgi:integrase
LAYLIDGASTPNTVNSSVARTREYLTGKEVEKLMEAARKSSRHGHRDATMILIAYRHGLRASEVCDLQWHQVEINSGRLHVRRTKRGTPSVHPIQGDELRALRRLQREQPPGPHVFASERGGPIAPKSFHTAHFAPRGARPYGLPYSPAHGCGYALGECRPRHPGHPSLDGAQEYPAHGALIPSWRPIGSRTFGADGGGQQGERPLLPLTRGNLRVFTAGVGPRKASIAW